MNFVYCAIGITTCFRTWKASLPIWWSNWIEPLTRRLAYARRHPLPQGERGRKGSLRDEPSRNTFSKTLALLHRAQMGRDRGRIGACAQTARSVVGMKSFRQHLAGNAQLSHSLPPCGGG